MRLLPQPQSITTIWPVPSYRCEQLAQGCYAALPRVGFEPVTYWSQVQHSTHCATAPPSKILVKKSRSHRPRFFLRNARPSHTEQRRMSPLFIGCPYYSRWPMCKVWKRNNCHGCHENERNWHTVLLHLTICTYKDWRLFGNSPHQKLLRLDHTS